MSIANFIFIYIVVYQSQIPGSPWPFENLLAPTDIATSAVYRIITPPLWPDFSVCTGQNGKCHVAEKLFFPALSHPDVSLLTALYTQKVQTWAIYNRAYLFDHELEEQVSCMGGKKGVTTLVWWSGEHKIKRQWEEPMEFNTFF